MRTNISDKTSVGLRRIAKASRQRAMGRAEVSLKLLVGIIIGTEFLGGPLLLTLGVFFDFSLIQWPAFSACWMLGSAVVGAYCGLTLLPRFSRDRGRIVDFLIDPNQVRCSLGHAFPPKR